jgi:hypothetical protein
MIEIITDIHNDTQIFWGQTTRQAISHPGTAHTACQRDDLHDFWRLPFHYLHSWH